MTLTTADVKAAGLTGITLDPAEFPDDESAAKLFNVLGQALLAAQATQQAAAAAATPPEASVNMVTLTTGGLGTIEFPPNSGTEVPARNRTITIQWEEILRPDGYALATTPPDVT